MVKHILRTGAPAVGLLVVGWLDYATHPRVVFWPFYLVVLVPTALTRPGQAAVGYAGLAAGVALGFDLLGRPDLAPTIFPYWGAFAQLIAFTLVTYMIPKLIVERQRLAESESRLIHQRTELQTLNRRLVTALEELSVSKDRQFVELLDQHAGAVRELYGELERGLHVLRALRGESARVGGYDRTSEPQ